MPYRRAPLPLAIAFLLAASAAQARQEVALPTTRAVEIDGHAVRVHVAGLESRRSGSPVVVFEAGATQSLDAWAAVLPHIASVASVVAYDRAGLGQSEWDDETPTPRHVVTRLRRLLEVLGARPPYVLVGFSWGGLLARYFAGYHPDDIAGIVYVDPAPVFTQTIAEMIAPFDSVGAGRAGYDAFWSGYRALLTQTSVAARAEFDVYRGLMEAEPADRDLRPAPDVPVVVIVAAKPFPPVLQLPYDQQAHFEVDLRQRIRLLQDWVLASPAGTLVVSNTTTHAIPRDDPDLIVWAVQRVLAAATR